MHWQRRWARPDEWREAKALRLEMLADTPIAYQQRLSDAQQVPDDEWRSGHERRTTDPRARTVVVVDDDGRWLAQAAGREFGPVTEPPWQEPGIMAVYLTPALRGQGVLEAMVDDLAAWFRELGHTDMTLMVHEDNARALRAYEKLGFRLNGNSCPYPLDETRRDLEMARAL